MMKWTKKERFGGFKCITHDGVYIYYTKIDEYQFEYFIWWNDEHTATLSKEINIIVEE